MAFCTKDTESLSEVYQGVSEEDLPENENEELKDKEEMEKNVKKREKKLRREISKRLKSVSQEVKDALFDKYKCTVDDLFLREKDLKFLCFLDAEISKKTAEAESDSDDGSDSSTGSSKFAPIRRLKPSEAETGLEVLAPRALMGSTPVGDVLYICYICYISCVYDIRYICDIRHSVIFVIFAIFVMF
jgi:hypothetical protein